jgi:cell wall-associated NlpC family hydrolase
VRYALALVGLSALAALASAAPAAHGASPALRAKQAQAEAVLRRVNALDGRFGRVVDAWDGARIQLADSERTLKANERELVRARRENRIAQARLAQLLVALYEHGQPSLPEIVVGSSSVADIVDGIEAARSIDAYDRRVAAEARRWQATLTATRVTLVRTERVRRRTVARLAVERKQIGGMLAQRRRMLASVQSEVAVLQARELAHQKALAEAARARLAREARARAARAPAPVVTPAPPAVDTTTAATTTTDGVTTTVATTTALTTTTAPTVTTTAAAPALGPGVPQAATIALRYLGIPYQWGGASPATGFDCSGFVMYVFAQLGIQLPHQSAAQYAYGTPVPRSQLQPGDLVFYNDLSHVAIYIGNGEIVHAPQTGDVVKIAPLAQGGGTYDGARRL